MRRCFLGLFLVWMLGLAGCTGFRRAVGVANTWRVLPGGNSPLEARTREHVEALLATDPFRRRHLSFSGDIVLKTVPAVRKDRLGVPFYTSLRQKAHDRSGGLTLSTGRARPLMIVIAVLPDGTWDDRTLRHECCHAILLWHGIAGHPREFQAVAPLWY